MRMKTEGNLISFENKRKNEWTVQDFYENENGKKHYISSLEIFSGVDEAGYKLAKNAIDVRLQFY